MYDGSIQMRVSIKDIREIKAYALVEFAKNLPRGLSNQELQVYLIVMGFSSWAKKHGVIIDVLPDDRR